MSVAENVQKSCNKPVISINLDSKEEKYYINIKTVAIELNINASSISICLKRKSHKTATSKRDGSQYTFELKKKINCMRLKIETKYPNGRKGD